MSDLNQALTRLHAINGAAAIAAIGLLWWWSRDIERPHLTRAMMATILLVSAGLPRIEAVTPDLLLLALMTCLCSASPGSRR